MNKALKGFLFLVLSFSFFQACAAPEGKSPAQIQSEAIAISKELRCPASLNQSLFESEKPIASELKAKIYELLREGKSKDEILQFFASRYGEQIRYSPELTASTAVLWIVPLGCVLLVGAGGASMVLRRKKGKKNE